MGQLDQRAAYFLNHLNGGQQIQTEIDEGPVNAFLLVLFLLEYKHMMVKELLEPLVSEIDAQLFEAVVLCVGWGSSKNIDKDLVQSRHSSTFSIITINSEQSPLLTFTSLHRQMYRLWNFN